MLEVWESVAVHAGLCFQSGQLHLHALVLVPRPLAPAGDGYKVSADIAVPITYRQAAKSLTIFESPKPKTTCQLTQWNTWKTCVDGALHVALASGTPGTSNFCTNVEISVFA